MTRLIDLTDKRFERLIVIGRSVRTNRHGHLWWDCVCECGKLVEVKGQKLRSGITRSCGCLRSDVVAEMMSTHGLSHFTHEYLCWRNMHARCYNPKARGFKNYGGRGIIICARWHESNPKGLFNFICDMGRKPNRKLTIERINNNGDYRPANCKWATYSENLRNRRPYAECVS